MHDIDIFDLAVDDELGEKLVFVAHHNGVGFHADTRVASLSLIHI